MNSYKCQCAVGFTGKHCETSKYNDVSPFTHGKGCLCTESEICYVESTMHGTDFPALVKSIELVSRHRTETVSSNIHHASLFHSYPFSHPYLLPLLPLLLPILYRVKNTVRLIHNNLPWQLQRVVIGVL